MYLFFSFVIRYIDPCTWGLVTIYRLTLYLFYLLYCWCVFFFHLPFHVLFLFSLYTDASYLFVCNLLFCFTQRCLDEFCLKCFRNTGCQSLLAINSLLAKFSRVCVRIDFIVFNEWIWVEWFMNSLICSFVSCGFVTDCQKGRLLGHMCFTC